MPIDVHTAPEIAIRRSKVFGGTAKHWYQMQANRDLAVERTLGVGRRGDS